MSFWYLVLEVHVRIPLPLVADPSERYSSFGKRITSIAHEKLMKSIIAIALRIIGLFLFIISNVERCGACWSDRRVPCVVFI